MKTYPHRTLCIVCLLLLILLCLTACNGLLLAGNNGPETGTLLANEDGVTESIPETESEHTTEYDTESDSTVGAESDTEAQAETETETETEIETETETERRPDGTLPFVPDRPERIDTDWKAIWLSQFDLQTAYTTPAGTQRGVSEFRQRMATVLDNVAEDGFNTVVLQMRPNSDSTYPSEFYPPSVYAVGEYGAGFAYDPVAIIMEMCHARGLSVHAWINPLRVMTDENMQKIPNDYLTRQWYDDPEKNGDYIVSLDGMWYLNPAHSEVRDLIADGVAEILARYDVDGIHMDDYFYPTTSTDFDAAAYAAYTAGGGTAELADWRRSNLDTLMSELYATVKTHDLRALFGISPAGNLHTVYNDHYADVYNWCENPGYVDYICPQIYFGFEHENYDFVKVCGDWSEIIKTDYVSLMVGLTFHKAVGAADGIEDQYAGTGAREWIENRDILARSLTHTATLDKCVGVTVFCYQHMFDLATGEMLDKSATEHEAFVEKLATVTWHPSKKEDT